MRPLGVKKVTLKCEMILPVISVTLHRAWLSLLYLVSRLKVGGQISGPLITAPCPRKYSSKFDSIQNYLFEFDAV
jgi:hypothetical protein